MTEQKQIEEIVKLDIEESAGFYSAFINDMRISKNKPLSVSKTVMSFNCPKKDILHAIGIPKNAIILTKEEQNKILKATEKRINELKQQIKQARKETARTFANALKKVFIEQRNRFDKIVAQEQKTYKYLRDEDNKTHIKQIEDNANGQALMADKSIGYINKLLKEDFGVEVEE